MLRKGELGVEFVHLGINRSMHFYAYFYATFYAMPHVNLYDYPISPSVGMKGSSIQHAQMQFTHCLEFS